MLYRRRPSSARNILVENSSVRRRQLRTECPVLLLCHPCMSGSSSSSSQLRRCRSRGVSASAAAAAPPPSARNSDDGGDFWGDFPISSPLPRGIRSETERQRACRSWQSGRRGAWVATAVSAWGSKSPIQSIQGQQRATLLHLDLQPTSQPSQASSQPREALWSTSVSSPSRETCSSRSSTSSYPSNHLTTIQACAEAHRSLAFLPLL